MPRMIFMALLVAYVVTFWGSGRLTGLARLLASSSAPPVVGIAWMPDVGRLPSPEHFR